MLVAPVQKRNEQFVCRRDGVCLKPFRLVFMAAIRPQLQPMNMNDLSGQS